MGCDIHCYMEYKGPESDRWQDFGGRINPGRNYAMFGAMAGVRCGDVPHILPRGLPDDAAYSANDDAWIFITDDGGDGYCTPEQAQRYMEYGSRLQDPEKPLVHNRVSNPDWHSHSWLTVEEFELAIASYLKSAGFQIGALRLEGRKETAAELETLNPSITEEAKWALNGITEYWAILAALRCFEAQGKVARLVFWFDN